MLSAIGHWLGQLDPNTVIPVLTGIAAWLYHTARGDAKADARELVGLVVDNIASELHGDTFGAPPNADGAALFLARARDYVERRAWTALQKRGIQKTATAQKLLHEAIERATGALWSEYRSRMAQPAAPVSS